MRSEAAGLVRTSVELASVSGTTGVSGTGWMTAGHTSSGRGVAIPLTVLQTAAPVIVAGCRAAEVVPESPVNSVYASRKRMIAAQISATLRGIVVEFVLSGLTADHVCE